MPDILPDAELLRAAQTVAWAIEGAGQYPGPHGSRAERLRRDWPVLWWALDELKSAHQRRLAHLARQ